MPVRHEWDAVTDVIERCRALWVLIEVPKPTADEMAAELEVHLREHVAAGGAIDDVVGTDLEEFAAAWGSQRQGSPRTTHRLLRAINPPLATVATYAVVAHAVEWVAASALAWLLHPSDVAWLAGLVAATLAATRPGMLRRIVTSRRRAPVLVAAVTLVVVPLAVPLLARTLLVFGPPLVGWPWWATLLTVVAAIASLAGATPTAHGRWRLRGDQTASG